MRHLIALCLCLALALPAPAQKKTVPLKVVGDTVLVVKTMPFKVVAAPGADLYSWTLPAGVVADEDDNVLTVTKAPAGTFTVKVKTITFDLEKKTKVKDSGEVVVVLGKSPAPEPEPDPDPTPGPVSPLTAALKTAYASETESDKSTSVRGLAAVYAAGAGEVRKGTPKTVGQLTKAMQAGAEAAGVVGKVKGVQAVIAAHCKRLPTKSSAAIDDTNRELIAATLGEVSASLREVAP